MPPLATSLKNDQGNPIGVVMVWDPNPCPFVEAYLNIKAAEARWVEGQAAAWDLRAVVVPFDTEREGQVKAHFLDASARAWMRRAVRVPGHEPGASDAAPSAAATRTPPPRPRLNVCKILDNGSLDRPTGAFHSLLDNEATAHESEKYLAAFAQVYRAQDSPRLPAATPAASMSGQGQLPAQDIEALQTEREPVPNRCLKAPATIKELEDKYTTWVVDTQTPMARSSFASLRTAAPLAWLSLQPGSSGAACS